jgi:hypothetical protein
MLKKSLIAIAVLAIALPAIAADTQKYHKPWDSTTVVTYHWQDVSQINVVMDVGYWIQVKYDGDIKVEQDSSLGDPYTSYSGCAQDVEVKTNFAATIKATVDAASAAGGDWSATVNGFGTLDLAIGSSLVDVCVAGTKVDISKLTQEDNVKVAVVHIWVIPTDLK